MKKRKNGYFLRGSAYLHLDEYKKAKKDFSKVISGSKEYEDYLDIYRIYQECDLNADGAEYLEAALEIKRNLRKISITEAGYVIICQNLKRRRKS